MTDKKLYWHFAQVGSDNVARLGYNDGREIKVGETLRVEGEPVLCEHGLHASVKLWDALGYASGTKLSLCRVTLGDDAQHSNDKSVSSERTVIAVLDADATEKLLREFAHWCALQVIHLWDAPDVVRQYLETGDESLQDAARAAAWDAARAAARAATRDAAWDATWAATWAATRDAAWDATWAATWAATRDAARAAAWDATRDAARAAARAAELDKYADELERRAIELVAQQEQPHD